jgi:hypothetical protein
MKKLMIAPVILAATLAGFTGCGKARFQKQDFQATAVAGQYTKPKIDILVFQDKSDSMRTPINNLRGQLNGFLNGIDSRWDFNFTVLPLQGTMNLNGKYIVSQNCGGISGGTCLSPSQTSVFNNAQGDAGWINSIDSSVGNTDLGFQSISNNLNQSSISSSGFLRPDAALAMIVVSNGEDVTNVSWRDRGDGFQVIDYGSATTQGSFNQYRDQFANLKGSSLSRFYAIVANGGYSNCWGGGAWFGKRYWDMAGALGGRAYNLCDGSAFSSVLDDIRAQLNSMVEAYIFNFAVMNEEPIVSSIVVKKNGVTLPQSTTNGWQYIGYRVNQPTARSPQTSNNRTGYFIKLNGTAEYRGSDVISIDYQRQ